MTVLVFAAFTFSTHDEPFGCLFFALSACIRGSWFVLQCRCLYGQKCWPNASDFSALESQISQPLIYPKPPASACYPVSSPSGNCTDVQVNQLDGNWRANQSGSQEYSNFESYGSISACY